MSAGPFVSREGAGFSLNGKPYRFVGANLWFAAHLAADTTNGGRARLNRELDRLKQIGVTNVRILASAEEGPLRHSITPGFRTRDGWNEALFEGLDYCLIALAQRDMRGVFYLTNYWEWSGGMMTYLAYTTGEYFDNNDPDQFLLAFENRVADFYTTPAAVGMYHDHVRRIVDRVNSISGLAYRDDPAIMAWQLANEPRPGGTDDVIARQADAYLAWIAATAALIRRLDRNHLVSLGQEGLVATNGREDLFRAAHEHVDYCTAHIWPLNWGWLKGHDIAGSWAAARQKASDYIAAHVRLAADLGKPLVIEEFGFPRDDESLEPEQSDSFRRLYYALIFDAVETGIGTGSPLVGSNFWAWSGEARAVHGDRRFRTGDRAFMGDPPHEPQGWYGVFDTDHEMAALVQVHAERLSR